MNKKGISFFFFCLFVYANFFRFYALPVPRPHTLSCPFPFSYPRSSLLICFFVLNATPLSANDLLCMYLTNELSSPHYF